MNLNVHMLESYVYEQCDDDTKLQLTAACKTLSLLRYVPVNRCLGRCGIVFSILSDATWYRTKGYDIVLFLRGSLSLRNFQELHWFGMGTIRDSYGDSQSCNTYVKVWVRTPYWMIKRFEHIIKCRTQTLSIISIDPDRPLSLRKRKRHAWVDEEDINRLLHKCTGSRLDRLLRGLCNTIKRWM